MAVAVSAEVMTGGATMEMTSDLLSSPSALVAVSCTVALPACDGVPVMAPVAASNVAQAGRPAVANVMGTAPPAVRVYTKGAPTVPLAVSALLMFGGVGVGGGAAMVRVNVLLSPPTALLAARSMVKVPGAGGVPDRSPLAASNESHAGRPLTLRVMGCVPSAVSVYAKAWPPVPLAVSAEVMIAGPATVSTSVWLLVPTPLVAVNPMDSVPAAVGVPLMTPVAASKLAHAGSDETDRVTPAGVAVSV